VWYRHGAPAAVADAKYKAESPSGYPNADLYQMLAYCTALGLPRGHLIYAKGAGDAVRHVVREAGVEILGHALGLDCQPEILLSQVNGLPGFLAQTSGECASRS
jgi:5-methylcytosine-specific restriction enzyme subunit McrC